MIVNSLLSRYKGGFTTDTDSTSVGTYGRREGYLALTEITAVPNVGIASNRYLTRYSSAFSTLTAQLSPTTVRSTPYVGQWGPGASVGIPQPSTGSTVTAQVRSLTMTEDEFGNVSFSPELLTLMESRAAQTDLYLRRLGEGTLNGRAAAATVAGDIDPDAKSGKVQTWEQSYSQDTIEAKESPQWYPPNDGRVVSADVTILTPGSSATTVQVLVSGVPISFQVNGSTSTTITVPAGRFHVFGMATTQVDVTALNAVTAKTISVGGGAAGLAIRVIVGEA